MNEHNNKEKRHKRGRKPYCNGIRKRVTFYLDQTAIKCLDQLFPDIVRSDFVSYCIKKEMLGENYDELVWILWHKMDMQYGETEQRKSKKLSIFGPSKGRLIAWR